MILSPMAGEREREPQNLVANKYDGQTKHTHISAILDKALRSQVDRTHVFTSIVIVLC